MKKFQMFVGFTAVVACSELGCDMRPFVAKDMEDAGGFLELPHSSLADGGQDTEDAQDTEDSGNGPDSAEVGKAIQIGKRDPSLVEKDAQDSEDSKDSGLSLDELPTAILISTCESEPDEVAVPWPTKGYHFCETIQAVAYRADDEGAYGVSAKYSWQIHDDQVAVFANEPEYEHKGLRHVVAKRDMFGLPELAQEPETEFTVCVEPLGGWPPGYGPLCRALPIRAVVNVYSPWCFSGTTFQSDCDFIQVIQDGRYLTIEPDGQGSIWGKEIHFYLNGLFYQATLSDADNMQGTVTDPSEQQVLGGWSAYKYTM
ncbi:MAG: hypothetical protein WCW31_02585 [Patescibacteria group bacterium]|jgi:hypothetical protein